MDKEKTSNHQLYSLIACATRGSSLLVAALPVTELCGRGERIASIVSSLFRVAFILLYYALGQPSPNGDLVQVIRTVFGKWLGAIISIYFIILCTHSGIQITAYIGQLITTEYLITSPVYFINLLIFITMVGVLLHDLEAIVCSFEILLKAVTLIMAFLFLASISNIRVHYIQPMLGNGFYPIFKGSLYITSYRIWLLIFLNMIYLIHMDNSSFVLRAMFKGCFLGSLTMFPVMLMSILVLGTHVISVFVYPTYFLVEQISFGSLPRVEGLIVSAWLITLFFEEFYYLHVGIQSISTSMRPKDYWKIVYPILFVVLICSNITYPSSAYLAFWDKYVQISYSFTTRLPLSVFIVIVYFTQKTLQETSRPEFAQDSA